MKLQDQVCTLEQAKRLRELGVTQYSFFWWIKEGGNEYLLLHYGMTANRTGFSAYTVAELGEMLPTGFDTMRTTLTLEKSEWLGYDNDSKYFPDAKGYQTEAQCRAAMLIRLIESNLTTIEQINKTV